MSEPFDPYRKWLGIPPHEQPPHHYRLLGIAPLEEDADVIEHAANRQMAHIRTLQHGPQGAISQRLLTELSAAKLCLLTPDRKAVYDAQLRERLAGAQLALPPVAAPASLLPPDAAMEPGAAIGTAPSRPPVMFRSSPSTAAMARSRKRRSLLPIAICVVSLLVLFMVGAAVWVFTNPFADDQQPRHAAKAASTKSHGAETSDTKRNAADGSSSGSATAKPEKAGELLDRIRQALFHAKRALAERKLDECRTELARADQFLARQMLPETPALKEQADDIRVLAALVDRFWVIVLDNAKHKVQPGEKLTLRKRSLELLARDGDQIEYRLDGGSYKSAVRELDPWVALLLAFKTIKVAEPVTLVPAAAFLAVDAKATDDLRKLARQFYALARTAGEKDEALARQLGLNTPDAPIKLDSDLAPKKGKAKKAKA